MSGSHGDLQALLSDAIGAKDSPARSRALEKLMKIAESIAAQRNRAHAESVGVSAVAYLHQRLERGEVRFETEEQLIAYLRKVATSKAVEAIRRDARHLGLPDRGVGEDGDMPGRLAQQAAPHPSPSSLAAHHEVALAVGQWLSRFPRELRAPISAYTARHVDGDGAQSHATALSLLELAIVDLVRRVEDAVGLFPSQLQSLARLRFAALEMETWAVQAAEVSAVMQFARGLSPRDRLVVEMREAGMDPSVVAAKLKLTANHVRVIHHRARSSAMAAALPSRGGAPGESSTEPTGMAGSP